MELEIMLNKISKIQNGRWQAFSCVIRGCFKKDKTKDGEELFGRQERSSDQWEAGKYEQSAFSMVMIF